MPAARVTSKGRITIPQAVRVALRLHTGTHVDFVPVADGFMIVPLRDEAASLKGRFAGRVARPVSLAAMDQAIASEAAQSHASDPAQP
jgi:AbrB family looped-hinge helix DNA binding protein